MKELSRLTAILFLLFLTFPMLSLSETNVDTISKDMSTGKILDINKINKKNIPKGIRELIAIGKAKIIAKEGKDGNIVYIVSDP